MRADNPCQTIFQVVGPTMTDNAGLLSALKTQICHPGFVWEELAHQPRSLHVDLQSPIINIRYVDEHRGSANNRPIRVELIPSIAPNPAQESEIDKPLHYQIPFIAQRPDISATYLKAVLYEHCQLGQGIAHSVYRKLLGQTLDRTEIEAALSAINQGSLSDHETDAFLHAFCQYLSDQELRDIAKIRCQWGPRLTWPQTMVVDKHSLGGIPGSRVTMIVVPIVAAHGLLIPKTSTRAITSAAGTADAMEVLARVDLSPAQIEQVAKKSNGCIAWNQQLNHTRVDTALNRQTRPLQIDTRRWSVASILSKKYCAGATHVVIDIPYGPHGKVGTLHEAEALANVFADVGQHLGMVVKAFPTPGHNPIGRGIGPVLEATDVIQVLNRTPQAPSDLREKSLFFAAQILAFDPAIGSFEAGYVRAQALLDSGAAMAKMQQIIALQGEQAPAHRDRCLRQSVVSGQAGRINAIDGHIISAIARAAGAPQDPLAGVYLHCIVQEHVDKGSLLYEIFAQDQGAIQTALALSQTDNGYRLSE